MGGNSESCLQVRLELEGEEARYIYKTLKPDDEMVENVEYHSKLENNRIIYVFRSCELLKLRNTIDDVLEKASLAEEVIKGVSSVGDGEYRSVS